MFDIMSLIPGRKKLSHSGWYSFNAVCCDKRGHRSDKRSRGGLKLDGNNWVMHCFNCGYSCSFTLGRSIGDKTKKFMGWLGIDSMQIQRWSLESLQQKDLLDFTQPKYKRETIKFKTHELPDSEPLDKQNIAHTVYIDYLLKRKVDPNILPFAVTPNEPGRMANRIIIPYMYRGKLVGYTSRFLDNRIPKFINIQEPGYVFGYDFQKPNWQVCIVTEGIFDALSINGCALMHNTISTEQAQLLAQLNRRIIIVPDRDKTGLDIIDRALEFGYSVSIPEWDIGVKDVNDAVIKYGQFPTLLSILQSATMSKIKLEMQRKKIGKTGF
jgi:hypothetical protein